MIRIDARLPGGGGGHWQVCDHFDTGKARARQQEHGGVLPEERIAAYKERIARFRAAPWARGLPRLAAAVIGHSASAELSSLESGGRFGLIAIGSVVIAFARSTPSQFSSAPGVETGRPVAQMCSS